jgi:hypothetical protein
LEEQEAKRVYIRIAAKALKLSSGSLGLVYQEEMFTTAGSITNKLINLYLSEFPRFSHFCDKISLLQAVEAHWVVRG